MALIRRDENPRRTTVKDPATGRQRSRKAQPPTMERTVFARDPETRERVTLKAGTVTPDWYTGKHDGRGTAPEGDAMPVHPALDTGSDPLPEGEAWQAYLDDVYAHARETGEAGPLRWPTASAHDTQERGIRDYLHLHLDPVAIAALEDLDADERAVLATLDDDDLQALYELDDAIQADADLDDERAELLVLTETPPHPDAEDTPSQGGDQDTPGGSGDGQPPTAEQLEQQAKADAVLVEGSVEVVLARVGDDAALASRALAAERARGEKARTTLTDELARRAAAAHVTAQA